MRTVRVPALQRTRVARQVAKRMAVAVVIEVEGAATDVRGLLEVEKGLLPFMRNEHSEAVLRDTQTIQVGAMYASFDVYVTSDTPITVRVTEKADIRVWLVLAVAASVAVMAAAIAFLTL